jgi:PAS domain S-box-containing protein
MNQDFLFPEVSVTNGSQSPTSPALPPVEPGPIRVPLARVVQYGGSVAGVTVAAIAGWFLHESFGLVAALAPFYGVVSLVALIWGGGPAALATGLSVTVLGVWHLRTDTPEGAIAIGLFAACGLMVGGTAIALRSRAGLHIDAGPGDGRAWDEQFRALVQASSDVVYRMSPDWAEMRFLLGRKFIQDTDVPSQNWLQKYIPPEDQSHVLAVINKAIRTKSVFELEHRVRRTDGTLGWTFSRAVPTLDATGAIREWLGTATDVTARKEAEEGRRRTEERLRLALASGRIGVWEWDLGTDTLSWSPEMFAITGVAPAAFGGTRDDFARLIHPDDRAVFQTQIETVLAAGDGFEVEHRIVRPDGSVRLLMSRGEVIRHQVGRADRVLGVAKDVTDRKLAEKAVRERELRLDLIVRHYPGMVAQVDRDLRYRYASPRYEEWFGLPPAAVVGRTVAEVIGPEAYARAEPFAKRALAGERISFVNQIILPSGKNRWVQVAFVPVTDGDAAGQGFFVFATDITERKQVEDALRAEKEYAESIVETLHEPLLVLHPDLKVKSVNPAFYTHFRVDPGDTVGRKVYELGNGQWDIPALRTLLEDVLPTNKVFNDYEVTHEFETIGRRVMLVNGRQLDHVQLILLGIRDITDRKRTEEALRASDERQAFLLRLADSLHPLSDPLAIQASAVRLLGEHLRANRIGYAESVDDGETFVVHNQYTAGLPELTGRLRTADFGAGLAEKLRASQRVLCADVACNPALSAAEREAFAAIGIAAEAVFPLVKAGRLVAVFFVHFQHSHDWTPIEIGLIEETAERTWATVERAKAEAAFLRSHDTFLGLVHNAPYGVYLLDAGFRLVEVSAGAQKVFAGVRPLIGRDFAEVLRTIWPEPFASDAIDRFRHTLATGESYHSVDTTEQQHDVPVVESYDWQIERVTMPDGGFGVVCYFYETTELRLAAARDSFRVRLADALRPIDDPDEMKVTACRLLLQHLATGRVSYAEVEPDDIHVVVAAESTNGLPSFSGRHRADDFGSTIIAALRNGHTLAINDIAGQKELTDAEQEAYAAFGIQALVVVPLVKNGRWLAALGVNCAAPRTWSAEEIQLVEEVAERMWAAVERAKAMAELRASEERLRLAVRAANIGLWDWNLKTNAVVYSPEWKAQLGYDEGELGNELQEWESRVHPDDLGPSLGSVRQTIAGPDSSHEIEFRMRHKDGSWRWIFARAEVIRDVMGAPLRMLGCHIDMTAKRQDEQALREREARMAAILNTAADAVITIDHAGLIESVNAAAERMFGYAPGELIGRNVSVLMPSPHQEQHDGYIARYLATGQARIIGIGRELMALRKNGTLFPIELAVSEIDHLRQFTGIVRDITRRKELEREVVEAATAEQRRIGEDLHDTVGQELTALNIQCGDLVATLGTDPPLCLKIAESLASGLRRCQRQLRAVMRGLLPVAVDAGGLMAALSDLVDRTRMENGMECEFDCPVPISVADNLIATQLFLIVQEAVHNAIKHAGARMIRVTIAPRAGGGLMIRVRDDGRGLSPEPIPGNGHGLRIMQHRAAILGARLTIGQAIPTGTVVSCEYFGGSDV